MKANDPFWDDLGPSTLRAIEFRRRGYNRWGKIPVEYLDEAFIFQEMQHIPIDDKPKLTTSTRLRADQLFETIRDAPSFKSSKLADKRSFWRGLYFSLNHAHNSDSAIGYSEHVNRTPQIHRQVIQAAVDSGFIRRLKSKTGGRHQPIYTCWLVFGCCFLGSLDRGFFGWEWTVSVIRRYTEV